jgi:hypothetical protein
MKKMMKKTKKVIVNAAKWYLDRMGKSRAFYMTGSIPF